MKVGCKETGQNAGADKMSLKMIHFKSIHLKTMKRKRAPSMFPRGNTFRCEEFLTTQHTVESEVPFFPQIL